VSGAIALPNGPINAPQLRNAIDIYTPSMIDSLLIGGCEQGAANLIAHHAIAIDFRANANAEAFDARVSIIGNNTSENCGLDINLGIGSGTTGAGRTLNDLGDADTGANRFQNYPEFVSVTPLPGHQQWRVEFLVPSTTADSAYPLTMDFHRAHRNHAGEWIDSVDYPTTSAGLSQTLTLNFPDPVKHLSPGRDRHRRRGSNQ
jgi:hypothetical protein